MSVHELSVAAELRLESNLRDGITYMRDGNFDLAEEVYAAALEMCQHEFGDSDSRTVSLLGNLARACIYGRKFDVAAGLLERQARRVCVDMILHFLIS